MQADKPVTNLTFTVEESTGSRTVDIPLRDLVIAGWTGRDKTAMEHHADELAELGVPRPTAMPLFYRAAASRLTGADQIAVCGTETGGEAEAVMVKYAGAFYVGVGSDHTDRALEAHSVALSKQICDKPVGPTLWPYEEVAPHWDQLVLRSWIHEDGARRIYQEGAVSALLAPTTLIERYVGTTGTLDDGTAMFCGTLPAKGGVRPTPTIEVVLDDPVRKRALRHAYRTELLPIIA